VSIRPVQWRDARLFIIDQTLLPIEYREIPLDSVEAVWEAIRALRVRGAPAIGVCAAFGVVVALTQHKPTDTKGARRVVDEAAAYLATSRPTAVNLFWALDRMKACAHEFPSGDGLDRLLSTLEHEAIEICDEDVRRCEAIGNHGSALIQDGSGILTHCNAGALATAGYGTALAGMFRAHEMGKRFHVFADETRPLLQGARLTAWELANAGIHVTVICDSAAAQVMREGRVQLVIVGADRIAANGDTANKIGTYGVAQLARAHAIPFYVAAPLSTFDTAIQHGGQIPIEQRDSSEIANAFGKRTVPEGVDTYNPAFDVTPAALIAGIVTEQGILRPPFENAIRSCVQAHAKVHA
jgi:methylthioribose-1-phosphate isomerase